MNSCLYECEVVHRRLIPKAHGFAYRIFMISIDLAEIDTLARNVRGFSHNGPNVYAFNDRDHLAPDDRPVRRKLEEYLAGQGVVLPPDARVQLVTMPRVLGYIFNPVSFFFCYDDQDLPLCAVVEVGNTFREMKLYFIPKFSPRDNFHLRAPKEFYVSPFSSLDTHFDFKLRLPGEQLDIHIDDYDDRKLSLVSSLLGRRAEFSTGRLWWFTLKYPFITLKIISLIHWHALLLWVKRVPFFAKTARPEAQKDVLRPHHSITAQP